MFQTCHHVMPSGLRCQSPAMRGTAFCYFHGRRASPPKSSPAEAHIEIPATLDRAGIPQALRRVMNALANNQIRSRRASILFYGLQMAIDHPDAPRPRACSNAVQPNRPRPADLRHRRPASPKSGAEASLESAPMQDSLLRCRVETQRRQARLVRALARSNSPASIRAFDQSHGSRLNGCVRSDLGEGPHRFGSAGPVGNAFHLVTVSDGVLRGVGGVVGDGVVDGGDVEVAEAEVAVTGLVGIGSPGGCPLSERS